MIGSPDSLSTSPVNLSDRGLSEFVSDPEATMEDEALLVNSPMIDELSLTHVGTWNQLVSRTNWEKGEVIFLWRMAMVEANLPRGAYSDEAWARRVGKVTPQHVGRLRRVHERFAESASQYPTLYWSHFQAALDWDDAELWLQGAMDASWSVAQMRFQRWEALGAPEDLKPKDEDVILAEIQEDVYTREELQEAADRAATMVGRTEGRIAEIGAADIAERFDADNPPFETGEDDTAKKEKKTSKKAVEEGMSVEGVPTGELLATLADFSDFPADLAEAFELLKVALLNHKLGAWKEVAQTKVLQKMETFKALVCSVEREDSRD